MKTIKELEAIKHYVRGREKITLNIKVLKDVLGLIDEIRDDGYVPLAKEMLELKARIEG